MKKTTLLAGLILMTIAGGVTPRAEAIPFGASLVDKVGLQWLPLLYTEATVSERVFSLTDAGSDFYGFRYASTTEMHDLFKSIGMWDYSGYWYASHLPSTPEFLEITGLIPARGGSSFYQYNDTYDFIMYLGLSGLGGTLGDTVTQNWDDSVHFLAGSNESAGEYRGFHWLVYDPAPVPEPSTFLMMGAGLAGLVAYRRRAKK